MKSFKFDIGQQVSLTKSDEAGEIIGRAQYATSEDNYLLRYQAGDGRQIEDWWAESAIQKT